MRCGCRQARSHNPNTRELAWPSAAPAPGGAKKGKSTCPGRSISVPKLDDRARDQLTQWMLTLERPKHDATTTAAQRRDGAQICSAVATSAEPEPTSPKASDSIEA